MTALGLGDIAAFPFVEAPDKRNIQDGVRLLEELGLKTDAETEKLVADINAERKASYQQLAKQNNVSVELLVPYLV